MANDSAIDRLCFALKPLIIFAILIYQKFNQETAFNAAIAGGQVSEFAYITRLGIQRTVDSF